MNYYLRQAIMLYSLLILPFYGIPQKQMKCFRDDPRAGMREQKVDMKHMLLEVSFEPQKWLVKGKVIYRFVPLRNTVDSFFLDAPGIGFQQVKLNGKKMDNRVSEKGIMLYPDSSLKWRKEYSLDITYEANPRKGIYFIGWNDPQNISRKQIWTQGQGTNNRYWIPSYDSPNDKLVTELKITFDGEYQVLSNGEKLGVKTNRSTETKTWHYKMSGKHSSYLVMLGIGKYDIENRESSSGVSLHLYYYPDEPNRMGPTYRYSRKIMDILEKETGVPYPWSGYSQIPVQDFLYGAMENTTATVFGDFYHVDRRAYMDKNYVSVNAHELAHNWFGDLITLTGKEDIWLHESFATHYAKVCTREIWGEDHYQWTRRKELRRAWKAAKKNTRPIRFTGAGTNRIYPKGSLVLDMLKDVVGKEQFDSVITYYLREHAHSNVTTYDLMDAFRKVLGMNLNWFFDEWIFHGGIPHFKVSYQDLEGKDGRFTRLTVKQTHETGSLVGYFKMPVNIEVHYQNGKMSRKRVWVEGEQNAFNIPNERNDDIAFVLFDPGCRLIKRMTFEKDLDELEKQALNAPLIIDRFEALKAMRAYDTEEKRKILLEVYEKAHFHMTRSEVIRQLSGDRDDKSLELLSEALSDPDPKVRRAVLQNVEEIPQTLKGKFEAALKDSSYKNLETALKKLAVQYPASLDEYLKVTEGVKGVGSSVRVTWLELATQQERKRYIRELVNLAGRFYEFRTRINAMNALKRLNYCTDQVIKFVTDAIMHPNKRLSRPAGKVLQYFYEQNNYRQMIDAHVEAKHWEKWQMELIKKYTR